MVENNNEVGERAARVYANAKLLARRLNLSGHSSLLVLLGRSFQDAGKINETSASIERVAGLSLRGAPGAKVELTGKFSTGASLSGFTPRLAFKNFGEVGVECVTTSLHSLMHSLLTQNSKLRLKFRIPQKYAP